MAVSFLKNTNALNMDSSVSSAKIAFSLSSFTGAVVAHIAVHSEEVAVLSVVDSANNVYSQLASGEAYSTTVSAGFPGVTAEETSNHSYVDGEAWGYVYTSGSPTSVTVTLTNGARFAVLLEAYTNGTFAGAKQGSTTQPTTLGGGVSTPIYAFSTTGASTVVSFGFSTAESFNWSVANSKGTLRNQVSGSSGGDKAIGICAVEATASGSVATASITPPTSGGDSEVIDSTSVVGTTGDIQGAIVAGQSNIAFPAAYVVCAVEMAATA